MDNAKKIITKAYSLEQGKEIALAKEFLSLDDKLVSLETDIKSIPVSIEKKIADVAEEIKNAFPETPEFPTEMSISNLPDIQKVEIINPPEQKEQKAPIVNVEAPQVTVEAPIINVDTSKLEEGIDRVVEILERPESEEIEKVTLVDENGKPLKFPENKFYGGSSISKYITNVAGETINPSTEEKQDAIITAINNVKIDTGDIDLNTDQIETKLDTQTQTSSEESILLRRIVKLLESNAVVDIQNRQKVVVEGLVSSTLGRVISGLDSGAGIPVPNQPVNAGAPFPAPTAVYYQPVWIGPVDQRFQIMDNARLVYDAGIRSHLSFT